MVTNFAYDIRGLAAEREDYANTHDVPNGSTYYEIDGEHRLFMYDRTNNRWVEQ